MNLIKLISKNFKILFRNKITAFALLFGPLLIILISGLAFNNSLSYNIKVGVYSSNYSELSEQFITNLETEFHLVKFIDQDSCIDSIKSKGFHACIIIPPNMQITNSFKNVLDLYFDNSRVNIASTIKQSIFNSVDKTSQGISEGYTEDLLESLNLAETELQKLKSDLDLNVKRQLSIESLSSSSKASLENSDIKFDKDSLKLGDLKTQASKLKTDFTKAKDLSKDSINTLNSIVNETSSASLISVVDSYETRYLTLINSSADSAFVYDKIVLLAKEIDTLNANIDKSNEYKDSAKVNLGSINSDSSSTKKSLQNFQEKFKIIAESFSGNEIRDAESISSPVDLKEFEIVSGSKLNYMFPNLLILVIMFITIISSATQVINEKLNKAKIRMQMTPSPFMTTAVATFFTILIITLIQVALILLLTHFFFEIDILTSLLPIVIVLLFSAIFFTLLGIAIGYIFNAEHTVMLASISVSSFFFIVSDMILPLESLSESVIKIMNFTPFILATNLLRKVMFFNIPLSNLRMPFYFFIGLCILLLGLIALTSFIHRLYFKITMKHRAKMTLLEKK